MPFQKGNTYGKFPKPGNGRKSKEVVKIEKAAAEIAREYIEASVKPVIHTYFQLAHGRMVNKWHEGEIVGQEFEADAPTTRHFVDKLLPEIDGKTQNRPIAIQIVIEGSPGNGNGAAAQGAGNGRAVFVIGSEGD